MNTPHQTNKPIVYLGADHGGFHLKESVKKWLDEWGYEYHDLGAKQLDPEDDYPQFAFFVAQEVSADENSVGVLLCRSGGGMIIAANKVPGVRAVPVTTVSEVRHARQHNNANVISLAGDWLQESQAKTILKSFLTTAFSGHERHKRRLAQIDKYSRKIA